MHTLFQSQLNMRTTHIWIGFVVLLTLTSCEKVMWEEDQASTDPLTNFNYLWNEVDRKYSYFELKGIDWNAVGDRYRDSISTDMNEEELFHVMGHMLNELRDDHTNLIAPFDISVYDVALNNEPNYNERTIREHYLPEVIHTGAFTHNFVDGDSIAYVRYASFMATRI
jgi:hypothetical protein